MLLRMTWYITACIGLAFIALAAFLAAREHHWLRSSRVVDGKIIELISSRGSKGKTLFTPRVGYRAADGSQRDFKRSYSSSPADFSVGESVVVAYDSHTYDARILTFGQRFGAAAIIAAIGLAITSMAGFFIVGRTMVPRIYQEQQERQHFPF